MPTTCITVGLLSGTGERISVPHVPDGTWCNHIYDQCHMSHRSDLPSTPASQPKTALGLSTQRRNRLPDERLCPLYLGQWNAYLHRGDRGQDSPPPCSQGYLLVWVVDNTGFFNTIKFDGLVGKAVIHQFFQADAAYNAIPIQAGDGFNTGDIISQDTGNGTPLLFDGIHYKTVTGQVTGNVAFPTQFPFVGQGPFNTFLIFLTLDVLSNRSNFTTFVDFNFYNEVENPISTSTNFICWGMIDLRQVGATIDTGFPPVRYGLNGLVQSDQATKLGQPVSLLGLTFTEEIVNNVFNHNIVPLFNNSVGIPTAFIPEGP